MCGQTEAEVYQCFYCLFVELSGVGVKACTVAVCGGKMQMLRLRCRKLNAKKKQVLQQLLHLGQT